MKPSLEGNKANLARAADAMKRAEGALAILADGDATVVELASLMGVVRCTAERYLRTQLRGRVHIARWQKPDIPGALRAVWTLGPGKDAKKPEEPVPEPVPPPIVRDVTEQWFDERARQLCAEIRPYRHAQDVAFFGEAR